MSISSTLSLAEYQKHRNEKRKQAHFVIAQLSIGLQCEYVLCNRLNGTYPYFCNIDLQCLESLKYGDRLFLNWENNSYFMAILLELLERKKLRLYFFIMIEPRIHESDVAKLKPHAIKMFIQNNDHDDENIHNLPIGIRDGGELFIGHTGYSQHQLIEEGAQSRIKSILCLLCFTHSHGERGRCYEMLHNAPFVCNLNAYTGEENEGNGDRSHMLGSISVTLNYRKTHESMYVLSPRGVGEATHRFFEAIYLDAIPIVKRTHTAFDRQYRVFPCLVVEDWNEVTEELLIQNQRRLQREMARFKQAYPHCYTDFSQLYTLMLQM